MKKRFAITTENGKPTCPELAGYELPELPKVEDLIDIPNGCHEEFEFGYEAGYRKARELYEFTRQDLIDFAQSLKDYTHESHTILGHDEREASEFVDIFLNGRTPIAIEVEIIRVTLDGIVFPTTNPDGTVKGVWVYE